MKLLTVPANRGVLWVRSGFRIFFAYPASFAALFAAFLFGALLLLLLPGIGGVLLLAALPWVSQGFMLATHSALNGRPPRPDVFIAPVRGPRNQTISMLRLGLIYAAASILIMWVSNVVDAGRFEALQKAVVGTPAVTVADTAPEVAASAPAGSTGTSDSPYSAPEKPAATRPADGAANIARIESLLNDPQLLVGIVLRFGLAALLSIPFWHAPALVHWHQQGHAQALFSSTVACWRNRGAFALFVLTWAALLLIFSLVLTTVFTLLGVAHLVPLAALPAGLMFSTVFYASLYFTYADCFAPDEPVAAVPTSAAADA